MAIPNEYIEIVKLLVEKTKEGQVNWRSDRFSIYVFFEGARFIMWAGNDENTDEPFVAFALGDKKGATLDSWFVEGREVSDYSIMFELYKSAKRYAAGVPDTLKKLREGLTSSNAIGFTDADDEDSLI